MITQSNYALSASGTESSRFRSKFGGGWVDTFDAHTLLRKKLSTKELTFDDGELLAQFIDMGYVILPGAVSVEVIDQVNEDIAKAWLEKDTRYRVQTSHGEYKDLRSVERDQVLAKLLDVYAFSEAARKASFAPAILNFLRLLFEEEVLAFQNLTFEVGSTQAVHKDGAYVVVNEPLQFAASWIAREDIKAGSGELVYYPGSHRDRDYEFAANRMHWNPALDGNDVHDRFLRTIHEDAHERGQKLVSFLPRKGDALIWHAGLAHGGSPIEVPGLTRQSYVTHYCPISVRPNYFNFAPHRAKTRPAVEGGHISSWFYELMR